ncbi:MAG: hypothetical protein P4L49_10570 [Desulfosporosinus sp.]|nr:hypothetical protein [Desulfosporosinus sp.]
MASFLYREFIAENCRQIAEQELISRLEGFIELLNLGCDDSHFPCSEGNIWMTGPMMNMAGCGNSIPRDRTSLILM